MRNNKLHTPDGVKDYLPQEYYFKMQTQRNIEVVFSRYGYECLSAPMYEYIEVFENESSINQMQIYKFLDRDGSILALRSDMTPPIARIAATAYKAAELPLRFCYFENAFRCNDSYQGKLKEFTQAGVELIGVKSDDATAEVIALSINSLIAVGLPDFRLDIGQVQFFNGVITEAGFDSEMSQYLQQCIVNRDFVAVENAVKDEKIPDGIKTVLLELPLLIGGREMLARARKLVNNKISTDALDNLENIYEILCGYGVEKYISFDLSMLGHLGYYTGIIFRGYAQGAGFSIVDGGRYDNLLEKFGVNYPSVGFAIKINALISALEFQGVTIEMPKADTLLAYSKAGRNTALATGDQLRLQGLFIENSLSGEDLEQNILYAKHRGMGGILYFKDSENVVVVDITTDTRKEVALGELITK